MINTTGHELDTVISLHVDESHVVKRLLHRAQIEGRTDDTEDIIRRRQQLYLEQTKPLIDAYDERGLLIEIDGFGEVDEVTMRILSIWC